MLTQLLDILLSGGGSRMLYISKFVATDRSWFNAQACTV
uniref:Uncharacterized protein n=1 Tax=Anguilla anguilla TaxID=7936 RepID=A0A0E9Q5N2_ANGAN